MEFLKLVRRRSFVSEVVYTVLNIGLAIALAIVIYATQSILLALLIVLISKWRIFAVRLRFWFANLQSNLVDILVSISAVFLMFNVATAEVADSQKFLYLGLITLVYILWLLLIKPRSSRRFVIMQAAIALFGGVTVLFTESYNWPVSVVVIVMWLIGFSIARHVLSSYDETYLLPMSVIWGVVMAEIGWVAYHWTIGYRVPWLNDHYLPQIAILTLCLSFLVHRAYSSFYHHQKIRSNDILLPLLFTLAVSAALLLFFNGLDASI